MFLVRKCCQGAKGCHQRSWNVLDRSDHMSDEESNLLDKEQVTGSRTFRGVSALESESEMTEPAEFDTVTDEIRRV